MDVMVESHVCAGGIGDGGKPYHDLLFIKKSKTPHLIQTSFGKRQAIGCRLENQKTVPVCITIITIHYSKI